MLVSRSRQLDGFIRIDHSLDERSKYPAKKHARRVAAKLGVTDGLIFLPGQQTQYLEDSDQDVPFRQLRYFYYLSGVEEPDCAITYDIAQDNLILYITITPPQQAIWNGPSLSLEEAKKLYDVDRTKSIYDLRTDLVNWIHDHQGAIYLLHPSYKPPLESHLGLTEHSTLHILFDVRSLQYAIDSCRVIKDDYELEMLRRANKIATAAHTEVLRQLRNLKNEREVQAIFEEVCTANGVTTQSYHPIAGSGPNAAVLHWMKNNEDFGTREMLLLDAGPDWRCYASDVTRTFPISGNWPSEQCEAIYKLVHVMQQNVIGRLAPGIRFRDMQDLAVTIMTMGLLQLGIFKKAYGLSDIIKSGATRIFLPHGIGHHIGLEVHDVSPTPITGLTQQHIGSQQKRGPGSRSCDSLFRDAYEEDSPRRFTAVPPPDSLEAVLLEENMVITVEPGIYFSSIALELLVTDHIAQYIDMDVVKRYISVGGVRIEDDVLITKTGHEVISTAPKGEEALRIIRGEA